ISIMPRKRKSSYANTPHAQKMRLRRQSESCDAREERLSRQREIQNAKRSALLYDKNDPCNKAAIGEMTKLCQCGAKKFTGESLGMCCGNGKVTLDQFPPLPQLFEELFTGETQFSKHFLSRLRDNNSLFAMTSFGHKDASVQGWNPSVKIQGQIYHQLGSLMPPEDIRARYIQVYFLNTLEDQLRARGEHQNLNADILERITAWLNENNHYKGIFGTLQAWLYTIEYQKRGLPHAHFLFWIAPEHKIKAEEYDLAISAEIPKKEQDKELHDLVMKHMIHGPYDPLNEGSP
ncbi:uncharacterized protein LOC121857922, partial [Homarus americanus]|uniref:uncharacterized protein LOC121857922 n=1 Tax=Homarus americanus TaxID=6706 RepID=UPI001C493C63